MSEANCVTFWNSVSDIYGEEDLTKHDNDHELDIVFRNLDQIQTLTDLVCLGVADGSRDPIQILDHYIKTNSNNDNNKNNKMNVFLNDLSPELLNVCRKRMKKYPDYVVSYLIGPLDERINDIELVNKDCCFVAGVYNAKYISESLELYRQKKDIIGQIFTISYIYFKSDGSLEKSDIDLKFHIDKYESYMDAVISWMNDDGFVAYSIVTNTGFVSHYYSLEGFEKMLSVFKCSVKVQPAGNRYIVATITNSDNPTCLFTTLNNVIGNVVWEKQLKSLKAIADKFN